MRSIFPIVLRVACLLFVCSFDLQAATLTGTVRDEDGVLLTGASVYLLDNKIGAYTETGGTFSFTVSSAGTDTLLCRLIGYHEARVPVTIPDDITVTLTPSPVALDTVTVRTRRVDTVPPHERTSASVTVIDRDDIPDRVLTLDSVLERDAGVDIRTYGAPGSRSEISIRGSTTDQVTVYLDGIPLTAGGSGISGLESIPVGQLERIELYRGSAPGSFGSGAIGGVVNIETTPPGEDNVVGVSTSYGSFGANHQSLSARFGIGAYDYLSLSADRRAGENDFKYLDDRGTILDSSDDGWETRENADFESYSLTGSWRHQFDRSRADMSLQMQTSDRGVSGLGRRPALSARHEHDTLRWQMCYELPGHFSVQGWVSNEQRAFFDPDDEAGRRGRQDTETTIGYQGVQAHLQQVYGPIINHIRTELRRETYEASDAFQSDITLPSRRIYAGAGYEGEIMLAGDAMWIEPRLHYARISDRIQDVGWFIGSVSDSLRSQDRDILTASLGWRYRVREHLTIRANAGSYRRAPDFNELFGDTGDVVGNSDLVSEQSTNLDAGFHFERAMLPFDTDMTVFYRYARDLIQRRHYGDFVISENIGKAQVTGVELLADGRYTWRNLALRGSAAWQQALNKSDATAFRKDRYYDKYLPYHPVWQADATVALDIFRSLRATWRISHESELFRGPSNLDEEMIPARTLHDCSLDCSLTESATMRFDIENIADNRYVDRWGYPKPGRAWYVTVSMQLP